MQQNIERIEYRGGLLKNGIKTDDLPLKVWRGSEIPDDILKQISRDGILDYGGTYGNREAGDPMQYDSLTIFLEGDTVKIEFFNRVIAILGSNDEKLRRIFHIMSVLDSAHPGKA